MAEENLIQSNETVWEYLGKDGLYQMGPRNCRQVILDFIRDSETKSILDVGCGSGCLWDLLKQQDIPVIYKGVDYSYTFIDTCKKQFPEVLWEVDDGRTLANQLDKSFDLVVFLHSLDHTNDHESCLKQAHRVAKKNVIIVLWRPFVTNEGHHLNSKSVIANTQFRDSHLKEYNKDELDASIIESGFKILEDREVLDNDKRYSFFYLLEKT